MPHKPTSRLQFVKVCECGCQEPTLLAEQTERRIGHMRGQPLRFILGHARRGRISERRLPWKRHDDRGYITRHVPDHPYANYKGDVYEHRLVMERVLGRYLVPGEEVHHWNEVKSDNHPENLVVLSKADHRRLHKLISKLAARG
jgi:hypothetical protein